MKQVRIFQVDIDPQSLSHMSLKDLVNKYGEDAYFCFDLDYQGYSVYLFENRLETDAEYESRIKFEKGLRKLNKIKKRDKIKKNT